MKALIVYDSAYGNTAKVARAIELAIRMRDEALALPANRVDTELVKKFDMLIVGSPTQGGRATQAMQSFLKHLPDLNGMKVAVFDTRFAKTEHGVGLRMLMSTIGFAASKMAAALKTKGGKLILEPMGFVVRDKEGPIKDGELKRAAEWVRGIWQTQDATPGSVV